MPNPRTLGRPATFLVLVAVVCAASPSISQQRPSKQGTGLIAGRVLDAGTGRAVDDAVVVLRMPLPGGEDEIRRVLVDAHGRFVFPELPAGSYQLTADQFGYMRGEFEQLAPGRAGRRVELADGQRLTDISIAMWRLSSISGRVVDESGEPIAQAAVWAIRRTSRNGELVFVPSLRMASSDDRGFYRISQLPPGDYAVAVPARLSTFPLDVFRTAVTSGVSLGVPETSRLGDHRNFVVGEHVVATMSTAPIPPAPRGGRLMVFQTTFHPATTNVDEAQVLSLGSGDDRTNIEVRLQAAAAYVVSGRITGPEGPLARTPFRMFRAGNTTLHEARDFEVATGLTGNDGRFTLLTIPRGQFIISAPNARVPPASSQSRPPTLWSSEPVTVAGSDVTDLAVVARPATVLNGRITMASKVPLPKSFDVIVQALDDAPISTWNPRVSPDLRFSIEALPGRYIVLTFDGQGAPCTSLVDGRNVADESLIITTQAAVDIAISCTGVTTRVSGTARDDSGRPDARARVVAFPVDRSFWTGAGFRSSRQKSARVSRDGSFTIAHLPPGEYYIAAISEASTVDWELPAIRDRLVPMATRITIGAGEARAIDLRTAAFK